MSENTKSLITWLIVLTMVIAVSSVLFFSMPDFAGVERVTYTESSTTATTVTVNTTITSHDSTGVKAVAKTTTNKTGQTFAEVPTAQNTKTTTQPVVFPVNINTATADELMCIKGIGEVYATRIIEYRDKIGGYTSLDQLLNVKGIGEKRLAQWSEYLTVA